MLQQYLPFTVLKHKPFASSTSFFMVATVPTVYGIETLVSRTLYYNTVEELQQYLPFTVLKQAEVRISQEDPRFCCNSTYRLRY